MVMQRYKRNQKSEKKIKKKQWDVSGAERKVYREAGSS